MRNNVGYMLFISTYRSFILNFVRLESDSIIRQLKFTKILLTIFYKLLNVYQAHNKSFKLYYIV